MVNKLSAYKIYLLFSAITAMYFSLVATVMIVYHIEKVHLNPLQLILVGTTLEVACFIFEIPTSIVADVYSRKLSIVIGIVLGTVIANFSVRLPIIVSGVLFIILVLFLGLYIVSMIMDKKVADRVGGGGYEENN